MQLHLICTTNAPQICSRLIINSLGLQMKKRLNQTVVEKLRTERDREDIWDAQYPQLILILRKTGRKTWIYRYRRDGKYHSHKIGNFPVVSVEAARDRWRELQSQLSQGRNPAQEEKPACKVMCWRVSPARVTERRLEAASSST